MLPTFADLTDAMSRLTGCLVTSFVRLELLVLAVGGDPLSSRKGNRDEQDSDAGEETCYRFLT